MKFNSHLTELDRFSFRDNIIQFSFIFRTENCMHNPNCHPSTLLSLPNCHYWTSHLWVWQFDIRRNSVRGHLFLQKIIYQLFVKATYHLRTLREGWMRSKPNSSQFTPTISINYLPLIVLGIPWQDQQSFQHYLVCSYKINSGTKENQRDI